MADAPLLSPLAALARTHDPDRFLCALFAPAERREALFTLIAFNHELARAREAARTPLLALMRLQWWREAVEQAAAGKPPRRHEVAAPLHAAIAAGALDPADLLAMADAREAEAEEGGIPTAAAFRAYLRGSAGGFAVAAGRLLGAPPATLPALQQAGAAYGLAGVLRSVPALAAQGRCLLPEDALTAAGLTAEAVLAAPDSVAVRQVIAELAQAGQARLRETIAPLHGLPRGAISAALPLILARRDLARLAAGRTVPAIRGFGDRLAVSLAGLLGRLW
ncbi:squalene/phytoene synthase family protein [Siccirubricoccus sp. G192]|uniref:phytoene/squalene synthase family protein n=1 Tax=Siccirubricoccus sp. G192 TaxID=2849651 RepID=UPI001C2BFE9B|nr:squalene/phytoene synthase family protein [Siccirubricoccus sp. G192]MBV1798415.1 squalene/phytoene synthase family protein [Siccirubricoccus sp. G192]